jgi:hypothetical protein
VVIDKIKMMKYRMGSIKEAKSIKIEKIKKKIQDNKILVKFIKNSNSYVRSNN